MKLQQLETFFWTVNLGSFSAAAERLHATQSTVSMRIRELERSLGVELFDRSQRSARLTPKGRDLMEYAGRLLELVAQVEHRVAASESVSGTVRVGVAEVISVTWLPSLVELVLDTYPQVKLEIDEGLTGDLVNSLRAGGLDLILTPGRIPTDGLSAYSLGTVQFAWLAARSRVPHGGPFSPHDLAKLPIIGLKRESFHHATIQSWFNQENFYCRYLARCKSVAVAGSLTVAGLGISYLPLMCFNDKISDGALEILKTVPPLPPVEFIAAVSADEFQPLAQRVAELAVSVSTFNSTSQPA